MKRLWVRLKETELHALPDVWKEGVHPFARVLAYSCFGDFFLMNPSSGEIAVLLTLENDIYNTGYNLWEEFEKSFLSDPSVVENVLRSTDVVELEKRVGALKENEVFFPVPYPFLVGSGKLETYEKGDVWVFADIVGQSIGI